MSDDDKFNLMKWIGRNMPALNAEHVAEVMLQERQWLVRLLEESHEPAEPGIYVVHEGGETVRIGDLEQLAAALTEHFKPNKRLAE